MTNVRTLRSIIPFSVLFFAMACHVDERSIPSSSAVSPTTAVKQNVVADMDDYEYGIWINRADLNETSIPSDNRRPMNK